MAGFSRAAFRACDGDSVLAGDPALPGFLSDLVRPYGLALHDNLLDAGQSYGELAEPLIEAVTSPDAPVELLILAYRMHDVRPGRATATYLGSRCPGNPLAFAVCDQGLATPFSALQLINDYGCHRALLLVVEQGILPYELTDPSAALGRNAAVALLLEGPGTVAVHQFPAMPPDRVAAQLAALADPDATLILGAGIPPGFAGVRAPADQPFTGVWWELARMLPCGRRVIVADYDASLEYLCVLVAERGGSDGYPRVGPAGARGDRPGGRAGEAG
jgi:hypothetical protein